MKTCTVCGQSKPLDSFYNSKQTKDGKGYRCKSCDADARKKWNENNPERAKKSERSRHLKHRYNITLEEYNTMLEEQGGKCKICNSPETKTSHGTGTFAVDHCHETGKVRGLLCNNCNRGLGLFRDDVVILKSALNYLDTH